MKLVYLGHFIHEDGDLRIGISVSVGGGPKRTESLRVPIRHLDNEDVHNAMASAAMRILESHQGPPWEQDSLDLTWLH
uniref:Uncharacterized protein n=1 Tax=uncultured prokaryote TaxID=198431 RepID=A0A0H5QM29_9ZZZZ|nr:hypothetical protein [uncultured prokaryote]